MVKKTKRKYKLKITRKKYGGVGSSSNDSKKKSPNSDNDKLCPICLENISDNDRLNLSCHKKHFLCKTCAKQLTKNNINKCPLCRKVVKELESDKDALIVNLINSYFNETNFQGIFSENNKNGLIEYFKSIDSNKEYIMNMMRGFVYIYNGDRFVTNHSFIYNKNVLYNSLYNKNGTQKKRIGIATVEPLKNILIHLLSIKYLFEKYGITEYPDNINSLIEHTKNVLKQKNIPFPSEDEILIKSDRIENLIQNRNNNIIL